MVGFCGCISCFFGAGGGDLVAALCKMWLAQCLDMSRYHCDPIDLTSLS